MPLINFCPTFASKRVEDVLNEILKKEVIMKTMIKRTFVVLACALTFQACAFADNDKPITIEQLPTVAQQTIKTHFADGKIALVKVESEIMDKTYDVIFTDGTKVEFDRKGTWKEVERRDKAVPASLVPQQIANYVKANYSGQSVRKIEKDRKEYDVTLSNGVEITFNKNFKVIDID